MQGGRLQVVGSLFQHLSCRIIVAQQIPEDVRGSPVPSQLEFAVRQVTVFGEQLLLNFPRDVPVVARPATRSAQAKVDVSINEVRSRQADPSVIFLSAKWDRLPQSSFRITVEQIEQAVESLCSLFQNRTVENTVRPVFDAVDPGSPAGRLRSIRRETLHLLRDGLVKILKRYFDGSLLRFIRRGRQIVQAVNAVRLRADVVLSVTDHLVGDFGRSTAVSEVSWLANAGPGCA